MRPLEDAQTEIRTSLNAITLGTAPEKKTKNMSRFIEASFKAAAAEMTPDPGLGAKAYPAESHHTHWVVREDPFRWPLVADRQFILATRDTGYRSTSAAVSELIDNALQAGADSMSVFVREDRGEAQTSDMSIRSMSIAVLDNGCGMGATTLRTALQFGGSERFNDRSGAGRFGMGLPNSSVSQSRRVELYSWRDGQSSLYSYLDVREIAHGTMCEVPTPAPRQLPEWVQTAVETAGIELPNSGTLVHWPDCDRLPYRKASTIRAKLYNALGRTYRYALRGQVRLFVDGRLVEPIDPLMEWGAIAEKYGAATQYGDELCYEFRVATEPNRYSVVRVRFTVLPIRRWALLPLEERRKLGIIGGGGVSIVRAGREVDNGWHLMGAKRRENYDDWWRCEVCFEPELDEYFGVTHSKQGISPHPALQDAVAADLEEIARRLNSRVRSEFLRLATSRASRTDSEQQDPQGALPVEENAAARVARERERFLPPAEKRMRGFRIAHAPLTSGRFFVVVLERGELVVTVNSEHPMYPAATRADAGSRELFDIILLAAARAEIFVRSGGHAPARTHRGGEVADALEHFLEAWSDTLAAYLDRRA